MSSGVISLIGVIIGLFFFGFLAYKGWHLIPTAAFCGIIVALFSRMNVYEALTTLFMPAYANFFKSYFLLFMASSCFAKLMQDCGAIGVVAHALSKLCYKFKSRQAQRIAAILTIPLINTVIVYGGVNVFAAVFIVVHIGKELFEEFDIPWHYYGVGTLGTAVLSQFIPGTPELVNLVPNEFFGTDAMAGPVLGIIGTILFVIGGILYVKVCLENSDKHAEGFLPTGQRIIDEAPVAPEVANIPVIVAVIPLISVWVLLNLVKLPAVLSLFFSAILASVLFFKRLRGKFRNCLAEGSVRAVSTLALLCATVAFGGVVSASEGYTWVCDLIKGSGPAGAFQIAIFVNLLAGLTASASGSIKIVLNTFADAYLASGIAPGALHRLVICSSLGLNTLPHAAGVASIAATCKLELKDFYKHVFWMSVFLPTVISLILALLITLGLQC